MPQTKKSQPSNIFPPPPGRKLSIQKPVVSPVPIQNSNIFKTMIDGFAFGTGSSIAKETINNIPSIFGASVPTSTDNIPKISECEMWKKMFEECLRTEQATCTEIFNKIEKTCNTNITSYV